jgi:hypothetical protein
MFLNHFKTLIKKYFLKNKKYHGYLDKNIYKKVAYIIVNMKGMQH